MKLADLKEMSMRGGSFEERLKHHVPKYLDVIQKEHCGDIEEYRVFKYKDQGIQKYAIVDDVQTIAYFHTISSGDKITLDIMYVIDEYKRKGILSMFIHFCKRAEGFNKIEIGEIQSQDTVEAIKRIAKRFKTYWVKGNEKIPYDEKTIDQFYSIEDTTGWTIILESKTSNIKWPKFFDSKKIDLKQLYEGFLD